MIDFQFGDIVSYREEYYVYLVATKDILYLAKIFSKDFSKRYEDKIGMWLAKDQIDSSNMALAYITLTSEDFNQQICSASRPDQELYLVSTITKTKYELPADDIINLKKMIVEKRLTSARLREEVENLD